MIFRMIHFLMIPDLQYFTERGRNKKRSSMCLNLSLQIFFILGNEGLEEK